MLQLTIPLALAAAYFVGGSHRVDEARAGQLWGLLAALVAIVVHGIWLSSELFPSPGRISISQTLSLVAVTIAIAAWISARYQNGRGLARILYTLAGLATAATVFGHAPADSGAHYGWPLIAHITFSIVSYTLLAVASAVALSMAWKERQVRSNQVSKLASQLPSLLSLELVLFAAISVGFVALSLSIFSGLIFIDDIQAQHLTHKTILTVLAWLVFGGLLFGRWRYGWRGVIAVRWTLSGFALLLLAYFGSRLVLELVLNRQWG